MLKFSVDLDTAKPGIVLARNIEVGETFQIALMVEDDGKDGPAIFDTLVMEVFFNNLAPVLHVDQDQRPVAGELGGHSKSTVDAFSRKRIKPGKASDKESAFSQGTLLDLKLPPTAPVGPYKNATGRAGISDFDNPFRLVPGSPISVAAGKLLPGGVRASAIGTTNIVAVGHAFLGGRPLASESLVGTISVLPKGTKYDDRAPGTAYES